MLANLHAGIIWTDVLLMDEVLHEAALPNYSLEVFLLKSCGLLIDINFMCIYFKLPDFEYYQ